MGEPERWSANHKLQGDKLRFLARSSSSCCLSKTIVALLLFLAGPAYGQTAAAGALGRSPTPLGQRLAGVAVRLLNAATDERHEAGADGTGVPFFAAGAGTYQVELGAEGFQTARMAQLTVNASDSCSTRCSRPGTRR